MAKRKLVLVFLSFLGIILIAVGGFILASHGLAEDNSSGDKVEKIFIDKLDGYETNGLDEATLKLVEEFLAKPSKDQRLEAYRLIVANEIYRKADQKFWEFLKAAERPTESRIPDLQGNLALYEKYISEIDRITLKESKGRGDFLWQAWNNRGNAKVYEIFLSFILKDDTKKLEKLAKSALADYVKAYDYCGQNKDCANFVGQNIDFLTRIPLKNQNKKDEPQAGDKNGESQPGDKKGESQSNGGGLGNLFQKDDSSSEGIGDGKEDDKGGPKIILPGTSSGRSIKGAH